VEVIAVSGDTKELAVATVKDWHLDRLRLGFTHDTASMRPWARSGSTSRATCNRPLRPSPFAAVLSMSESKRSARERVRRFSPC
jgi:hypothetical protein